MEVYALQIRYHSNVYDTLVEVFLLLQKGSFAISILRWQVRMFPL